MPNPDNIKQILNFLHKIENLKRTYRFKTVENIDGDSVADHTWRLALMTFIVADDFKIKLDVLKSLKIALVHDLPESITDDIDAKKKVLENINVEKKEAEEEKAMREIQKSLSQELGEELFNLWKEYQLGETKEAKFVKALDKIEGVMTHMELHQGMIDGHEISAKHGNKEIKNFPEIKELFKAFKEELKEDFERQNIGWEEEYDDYL